MLSNKEYLNLLQKSVTKFHKDEILPSGIPKAQHVSLLPTMRQYQVRAVNWMLARELYPALMDKEHEIKLPSGGILADEMGLGKTVEVLACILANPRKSFDNKVTKDHNMTLERSLNGEPISPDIVDIGKQKSCLVQTKQVKIDKEFTAKVNRKRKFNNDCVEIIPAKISRYAVEVEDTVSKTIEEVVNRYKVSGARTMLQSRNDCRLSEMSPTSRIRKSTKYCNDMFEMKCCCVKDVDNDETIQCPLCKTYQHFSCVGYDRSDAADEYFCFNCWKLQPLIQSGATVIISPESICNQWNTEIEKYIKKDDIKVLVYNGVRANGYIQPPNLAQYDLVLTTYEVLRKEIYYAETATEERQLRHTKRYFAPTSPLTCVQWWRVCLDEAQMVEGITTKTAEMTKKLNVIHKWAVTGTPIQKSIHDLHGLIKFLGIKSYSKINNWKNLVNDTDSFLEFLPRVLWRTAKEDVIEELGVPEQKVVLHRLEFSPVESHFYQTQHEECSALFIQKISRFNDLSMPLNRIDRRLVNALLLPLLRIRQACSHPQAVRGKFESIKNTMSMRQLLHTMVDKAKLDCEEILRQKIASLNGIAGLKIIQQDYKSAIYVYRYVLRLVQEHLGKLRVDTLQKIHTTHNLAELLEMHPSLVSIRPPELQLRSYTRDLEKKYLNKRESSMKIIKESVANCQSKINELCKGRSLGYSEWWLYVLDRTEDDDELLNKLKRSLDRTDIFVQHHNYNLAKQLNSLPAIKIELAKWLSEADSSRQNVLKLLKTLKNSSTDFLATVAFYCHLSRGSPMKKTTKCILCVCESALKQYEELIFEKRNKSERQGQRNKYRQQTEASNVSQNNNKGVADLIDVNLNTSEFSKKGGLKTSEHEQILKELKRYSRSKRMPSVVRKNATQHLKLLGLVKKEFLYLNNYWTQISEQVLARDEVSMAKLTLRLPFPGEEDDERTLRKNRHIIKPYKVISELYQLESDSQQLEQMLKSKLGTLVYLENLQREGDTSTATCPICRNIFTDKWSVLHCGHCLCLECLPMLLKQSRNSLSCVQCRQPCDVKDIAYVANSSSDITRQLKGSYSTKVEAVITTIMNLRKADPLVKVLVFSLWEKVLDVIAEGFEMNNIVFRKLCQRNSKAALKDFKTKNVTALLLSLRYGAKGLNLVEATHVFLVEPVLNPSDELQAIGRVHRIGQTRETFVHQFIVKNTIEERMLSAIEASGVEQWSKEEITLQQLYNLFLLDMLNPTSLVEDEPSTSRNIDSTLEDENTDEQDSFPYESDDEY